MTTISSIFTGGGLVEIGARAAGMIPLWGVEYVDEIAQMARVNGLDVITADVRQVDPATLQRPDHLHASPPCPNFSQAKNGAEETREDVELAESIVRFIETLAPRTFTLENVPMYRFSQSWRLIQDALDRLGYWMNVQNHCNMASWGVSQTRKRMIVRAIRGGWLPPLPAPVPWVGWYSAIEDLIPTLPDSKFAPWQLARMPEGLLKTCLLAQGSFDHTDDGNDREVQPVGRRAAEELAYTVVANRNMLGMRAFVVASTPNATMRQGDEPAPTVVASEKNAPMRAFIVDCQRNGDGSKLTIRQPGEPIFTITASQNKRTVRAFIVDGANTHGDGRPITTREDGEPMFTVSAQSLTKNPIRAAVPGRVVRMTPRALARFQAIPDDYVLPDSDTLAVRIIGNAVPPLFARQLLKSFT